MNAAELQQKGKKELEALMDELVEKRDQSSGKAKQECIDGIALIESLINDINDAALTKVANAVSDATDELEGFVKNVKTKPLSDAINGTIDALNELSGKA